MVLTYQEAVEAGARAAFSEEQCDKRQALDVEANWAGRLDEHDQDEYRALTRAVLEAVEYAALLAEVERLETAVRRKDNHKRRANDQRDEARADLAALRTGNARERVAAAMYDGNEAFHAALASDRGQEYRRIERPSWADTDEYYRALYRARADAALAALGLTVTGGEGE